MQDFPRAKHALTVAGCELTKILASSLASQCEEPFTTLFSPQWELDGLADGAVTFARGMVIRRLSDVRTMLHSFYFERLAGLMLTHIIEQYLQVVLDAT